MTQIETEKLERLAEDEVLIGAIKRVIESALYPPTNPFASFNPDDNNEKLGENVRARMAAKELLEEGIKKLLSYKKVVPLQEKTNDAL